MRFELSPEPARGRLVLASISERNASVGEGKTLFSALGGALTSVQQMPNFLVRNIPQLVDAPAGIRSVQPLTPNATLDINAFSQLQHRQRRIVAGVARSLNNQARRLSAFVGVQVAAQLHLLKLVRNSVAHQASRLRQSVSNNHGRFLRQGGQSTAAKLPRRPKVKQLAEAALVAERACDQALAITHYEKALELEPNSSEWLSRLSKQYSDMSYAPGCSREEAMRLHKRAIEYAERAIAADPKSSMGYAAACISRGRLAVLSENRPKLQLAKNAQVSGRTGLGEALLCCADGQHTHRSPLTAACRLLPADWRGPPPLILLIFHSPFSFSCPLVPSTSPPATHPLIRATPRWPWR